MTVYLNDSGRKFKTLQEAKKYFREHPWNQGVWNIYNLKSPVYKYFVGSHIGWLNL